jgi:hypothetical protein
MRERSDKATANHISVFEKVVKSIEDDLQVGGGGGGVSLCRCDGCFSGAVEEGEGRLWRLILWGWGVRVMLDANSGIQKS